MTPASDLDMKQPPVPLVHLWVIPGAETNQKWHFQNSDQSVPVVIPTRKVPVWYTKVGVPVDLILLDCTAIASVKMVSVRLVPFGGHLPYRSSLTLQRFGHSVQRRRSELLTASFLSHILTRSIQTSTQIANHLKSNSNQTQIIGQKLNRRR